MKVTSEEQPQRQTVLSVELEPQDVEPYLEQAYRKVVQQLRVPGFRKGKAPRRIIEQMYGREYLLNEALDPMVNDATQKAVEQESLEVGGFPSISMEQFDPPTFKATIPLTPVVSLGEYRKVRVMADSVRISKAQVAEVLEQMRTDLAPYEPVAAAAQIEDLLNITVHGWVDDGERKAIADNEKVDYIPRANSRVPVPDFSDKVVGLKASDKALHFEIDVPEDFENKDVAGKTAKFDVTVHSVKRKQPMALDDEFAKGVGDGFESLDALRDRVKADLSAQEEQASTARHREEALAKVMEGASIELSPLIVDHEVEHVLHDYQEAITTGRMTIEVYQQYLAWAGKTAEEVRAEARPQAEERIKRSLVLEQVANDNDIEANDEEMTAEVEAMVSSDAAAANDADTVRHMFEHEDSRESLRRMILSRKTLDFLAELAASSVEKAPAKKKAATAKPEGTAKKPRAKKSPKRAATAES